MHHHISLCFSVSSAAAWPAGERERKEEDGGRRGRGQRQKDGRREQICLDRNRYKLLKQKRKKKRFKWETYLICSSAEEI